MTDPTAEPAAEPPQDDPDADLLRLAKEGGAWIVSIETARKRRDRAAARAAALKAAEEAKLKPTVFTARQLVELELPPLKYLIHDLLPVGTTLFASPPKIGKTWFNLQLAVAVATGQRFASYANTMQGKVLFLDLESGERREKYRLQKVLGVTPANDQLHIAFKFPRMDLGGLEILDRLIVEEEYVLVIIDIWNKFRRARPRNADIYDFDSMVGQEISDLARKHDMSILLTHHTKKGTVEDHLESISGSNGLPGAVDSNMVLSRRRGTGDAILQVTPRDAKEHKLAIEFNEGIWGILGDSEEVHGTTRRNAIHALLVQRGAMSARDIAEDLDDDPRSVRRSLRKMRDDGSVRQDTKGRWMATAI